MDARRSIPSVERLLADNAFAAVLARLPRAIVTATLRDVLDGLRNAAARGERIDIEPAAIAQKVDDVVNRLAAPSLIRVVNATGVILHTNLGRAPLAEVAIEAVRAVSDGYSNLEYDRKTGSRGSRYTHCRELLCALTGAEDALVVNNNAAALVLVLNTVSRRLEAIVSRGELVEIGGAFRVPEIMARSGARLREVGATNRTHPDDYRVALGPGTGALLKVHPSNFTIEGYTAEASIRDLAPIAREADVPLVHDIGSGLLVDPQKVGIDASEPTPQRSLADGADVVTMSGDKLLGGPQCGIILGDAARIARMRRNPLCRALRVDRMTIAALEATLRLYLEPPRALREIPVLRMLTMSAAELEQRARRIGDVARAAGFEVDIVDGESAVGGGSSPASQLPTRLVLLNAPGLSTAELERALRGGDPAAVVRIVDGRAAIDPRTVSDADERLLATALQRAAR